MTAPILVAHVAGETPAQHEAAMLAAIDSRITARYNMLETKFRALEKRMAQSMSDIQAEVRGIDDDASEDRHRMYAAMQELNGRIDRTKDQIIEVVTRTPHAPGPAAGWMTHRELRAGVAALMLAVAVGLTGVGAVLLTTAIGPERAADVVSRQIPTVTPAGVQPEPTP